ncbi:MAG: hypothetical protein ACREM2_11780 [Vulcanimicrobiaceae bacterium]
MLALVFALSPLFTAPGPPPHALATPVVTVSAAPTGPAGASQATPAAALPPDAAVIRNSGSTNIAGYTVVLRPNGEATVTVGGVERSARVAMPQTRWLFHLLRTNGPLEAMSYRACMKSASFGSASWVEWRGGRSPDFSCGGGPELRELGRTAGVIVSQLGIAPGPRIHLRL